MGYAKLRQRPANGNPHSSVLKPVAKKKSHIVVWVGVPLLLLVAGAATFGLFYIRDVGSVYSAKTCRHDMVRAETAKAAQSEESEKVIKDIRETVQMIKRLPPKTAKNQFLQYLDALDRLGFSQEELKIVKRIANDEFRR